MVEVAGEEVGPDGVGGVAGYMTTFFYAENGLLISSRAEQLHREINVLTDILDWVVILTNIGKMVSMVYQPC